MKSIKAMTMGELAAYVCSHLKNKDIDVTLTGGGCVSIYTDGDFVSYDLDFIETLTAGRGKLVKALEEIGFNEQNRYFQHPATEFFWNSQAGLWPLAMSHHPLLLK